MLLNLLIILEINQGLFFVPQLEDRKGLQALIYILALIPLVCGITYIIVKIVQQCRQRRRRHQLQFDELDREIDEARQYNNSLQVNSET